MRLPLFFLVTLIILCDYSEGFGYWMSGPYKHGHVVIHVEIKNIRGEFEFKYGLLNTAGGLVVDTTYDSVSDVDDSGMIVLVKNNWISCVDTTGKVLIPPIHKTDSKLFRSLRFNEDVMPVIAKGAGNARINGELTDWKIGFIDRRGNLVIDTVYDLHGAIGDCNNDRRNARGFKPVQCSNELNYIPDPYYLESDYYRFEGGRALVLKDFQKIVINKRGDSLFKIGGDNFYAYHKVKNTYGYFIVDSKRPISMFPENNTGLGFGLIDSNGKTLLQAKYREIQTFVEGYALVLVNETAGYKFLGKDGRFAFNKTFKIAMPFKNGYALVVYKGKRALLNKAGQLSYDSPDRYFKNE